MARQIIRLISNGSQVVALVRTAASGGRFGIPTTLQTVRMSIENVGQLNATRIANNPKVEVIESWKVDAANTGPRSNYTRTLRLMLDELSGHLKGPVIFAVNEVDTDNLESQVQALTLGATTDTVSRRRTVRL